MLLSDDRSSKSAVGRAYRAVSVQSQPRSAVERLFAFLVVGHARRQLLWFAVTRNPSAEWLAQQMAEAFPWNTAPTYLVRDNDRAYGQVFQRRIRAMGIRDRPISPRSPWQNPYAERLIGTLRRECLDHVLIVGERHLRRMLASYSSYYNESRTHLALEKDAPLRRAIQRCGAIITHANPFRTAPSLCADMIFGKDSTDDPKRLSPAVGVMCAESNKSLLPARIR
jgi:Integrase core domain